MSEIEARNRRDGAFQERQSATAAADGFRGPLRPPVTAPAVVQCVCGQASSKGPFCLDCYLLLPPSMKVAARRGQIRVATKWLRDEFARRKAWFCGRGFGRPGMGGDGGRV